MNLRPPALCLVAALVPAITAAGYVPLPLIPKSSIPEDMPEDIRRQVERLYTRSEKECVAAANALGRMGKDAAIAAPFLAAMLHDEVRHGNTGWSAARALMAIGKPALEPTILAFQFGNRYARMRAFKVFMELKAPQTIPFLISAAVDGLSASGGNARKTLAAIGQPALDYITEALKSPNAEIRRGAVLTVTAFPSTNTVQLLCERLGDDDALVRYEARRALLDLFRDDAKLRIPLNDSIRALLRDPDPDARQNGIRLAVYADDPSKVDEIVRLTKDNNAEVRRTAIETVGWIDGERAASALLDLLKSANPSVRLTALKALGRRKHKKALPAVIALLEDKSPSVRQEAVSALANFRGAALPALLKASADPDPIIRAKVVAGLRSTRDSRTLERLIALLDDADRGVRMEAVRSLTLYYTGYLKLPNRKEYRLPAGNEMPLHDKAVRSALLKALDDPNTVARVVAISALLDPRAPADLGAAAAALDSPDEAVQSVGLRYLGRLGQCPDIERIRELMKSRNQRVRASAISLLGRARDEQSYEYFVRALKEWRDVACSAIDALGNFGAKAVPHIANCLRHNDGRVRERAAKTLAAMNTPESRKVLAEALESNHYAMRAAAAAALGREVKQVRSPEVLADLLERDPSDQRGEIRRELTGFGAEAVPAVSRLLTNNNQSVRIAAINVLGDIHDRAAGDALAKAALAPVAEIKASAIRALARIGDRRAVPLARDALGSKEAVVRETAAAALGSLENKAALPALLKALDHNDWHMRWHAAESLGKLRDPRAREALASALADEHWYVRRAATEALGAIGDRASIPALMERIEDEHWYVRRCTRIALWRITGRHLGTNPVKWKEWWRNGMPSGDGPAASAEPKRKGKVKRPLPE